MSEDHRYADEEEEQVEETDTSQFDEALNEAERWKSNGNKHMASMEYNKAYNAYSTALKISPLGPYSHVYLSNRAAALLSLKRYSAAIIDSRRAIALAPTFGKGHARLGQSLYFLKDYTGAIEAYQNALQYEPDNQVTMIYLTKAKRKLERAEERVKHRDTVDNSDLVSVAESAVMFTPESPQRDYSAAVVIGRRNTNLAETLYSAIDHKYYTFPGMTTPDEIETDDDIKPSSQPHTSSISSAGSMDDAPYDESYSMNKGTIQWAQDREVKDDEEEDDEEEDDGHDPDFDQALKLQDRASVQLTKKQYNAAVELYSAALFLVPDDFNLTPHLFVGRANALNGLLRHEGAFNDCKMALNHNSNLAEAHTTMARSLFYLKDYQGAIESFDTAISCLAYGEFLSALDELYYEKAVELSKEQSSDKLNDDDAVSAASSSYHSIRTTGTGKRIPKLDPPRFVSRVEALNSAPIVPALPKPWAEKIPPALSTISIGPERNVVFITERLGVKLNRGPDGVIRVLYVSHQTDGDSPIVREGEIAAGDIVREAVGVDLRRPVTSVMWADTVALIKMADRPIILTVAIELSQPPPTVIEEMNRHAKQMNKKGLGSISLPKLKKSIVRSQRQNDNYLHDSISPSYANGTEPVKKKQSSLNSPGNDIVDGKYALDQALAQATAVFADVFKSNDHFDLLDENSEDVSNAKRISTSDYSEIAIEHDGGNGYSYDRDKSIDKHESLFTETSLHEGPTASAVVEKSSSRGTKKPVKKERKIPNINLSKWNPLAQAGAVLNPIAQATSVFVDAINPHDKVSDRYYSKVSKDHEIIFPRGLSSQGWDQDAWNATEWSRRLIHGGTVRLWVKGNDLWSDDPTAVYSMAIFSEPNIILIMRFPKNAAEVRMMLNLPSDGEQLGKSIDSFLIAEKVIDLKTCKLKLSKLTTPTSLCEDSRRTQFFELISPGETFSITARYSNSASEGDILIATSEWEHKISGALFSTYEQENSIRPLGWKHHLVIGSLHSFISHNKNNFLQQALCSTKDASIVDGMDDDGLTPIIFACFRRDSDAVSILLSAGADRFQVTSFGRKTLYHISAELLDVTTLSVLLSAGRGNPNAFDNLGRTPMYVAIVDGKNVNGSSDTQLLKSCLTLLENNGGLICSESKGSLLPHPVPYLSSKWKGAILSVVLLHCNYRYPMTVPFDGSLCSYYGYPLHVCLLSLRDKIAGMNKSQRSRERSAAADDEDLISTLQVLIDHGFEPNERIEYLQHDGVFVEELQNIIGYAPIQLLAAASLDLKELALIGAIKQSVQSSIEDLIATAAEVLIRNGARMNLEAPPKARPQRYAPSSINAKSILCTKNKLPHIERSLLKLDKNKVMLESFGADEDIKDVIITWIEARVVSAADMVKIREKDKDLSSVPDFKGPGGSDVNSCAICWKAFKKGLIGSGSKKKTVCILSKRVLCEDCCSKKLEKDGVTYKISDGQFNMARKDITRQEDEEREIENEKIRLQRLRVEMEKRAAEREKQDDLFGGAFETVKGFINNNVKDIKDLTENIKIKIEGDESDTEEDYVGLETTLAGTRDAFNERGERLNILRDKSAALKDSGQEYLRLAKELRMQQESRGGFFSR